MDVNYRCPECAMTFRSRGLMEKHWRHFCVGPETPDPQEQELIQARVEELERLKQRKAELHRSREQREEQLTRNDESGRRSRDSESLWEARSSGLLRLQKQAETKKEQEEELSSDRHSTASSLSIPLPPTPRMTIDRATPPASLLEPSYQSMEVEMYKKRLQRHKETKEELTAKKHIIENRLKEFEKQRPELEGGSTVLLDQLMTQQEQNQMSLMRLQQDQPLPSEKRTSFNDTQKPDFFIKQINIMRQRYLENGGGNPEILIDIAALEKDAIDLLEKHMQQDQLERENREKCRILNEELAAFEQENRHLEEELIRLHEANTENMEVQVHAYDEGLAEELMSARKEQYAREMARIEHEIELNNQEVRLDRIKRRLERLGMGQATIGS